MAEDTKPKRRIDVKGGLMAMAEGLTAMGGTRVPYYQNYLASQKASEAEKVLEKLRVTTAYYDSLDAEQGQPGVPPIASVPGQPQPNIAGPRPPMLQPSSTMPSIAPPPLAGSQGASAMSRWEQKPGSMERNPKTGRKEWVGGDWVESADYTAARKAKEAQAATAQETASGIRDISDEAGIFLEQYDRSYEEMHALDTNIGKKGVEGMLARWGGHIAKATDNAPATSSLENMSKPYAQKIATSLEGRATDADRDIWTELFPNVLKGPTEESVRDASNHLIVMQTKLQRSSPNENLNDIVAPMYERKGGPLKMIADQFYKKFPKLKPEVDYTKMSMAELKKLAGK